MRHQHLTRSVTYRRGDVVVELAATIGRTVFEMDDGAGAVLRVESRDYIIRASDLTLGSPLRGDRIVEAGDGQSFVYEVVPFGSEPCWRWSDPYRKTLRIHTKQVETQ
jgi:hypothetical protein